MSSEYLNPLEEINGLADRINNITKTEHLITDISKMEKGYVQQQLKNYQFMSEYELMNLIKNNLDSISNDILENESGYSTMLQDMRFIIPFIKVLNMVPIEYNTKLMCNKITYDYFTSENPDTTIKQQYLNMSKIINKEYIEKLKSIGLDNNTACNLALCRFSSSNEITNVKRLNFAMYFRDPSIMDEQRIVWIYEKLFDRISDLFYGTMFEVYSWSEQDDFGENFAEVYGSVGNAVLTILNNMTSEKITKILVEYSNKWISKGKPLTRFSLKSISNDYARVLRIVEYLNSISIEIP